MHPQPLVGSKFVKTSSVCIDVRRCNVGMLNWNTVRFAPISSKVSRVLDSVARSHGSPMKATKLRGVRFAALIGGLLAAQGRGFLRSFEFVSMTIFSGRRK